MMIHLFNNGDELYRREHALIVRFGGKRDVLSTSALNGGIRKNLKWAFNHDCKIDGRKDTPLKAPSYPEHIRIVASELGLEPDFACGMTTAADMENVAIVSETYKDLTVTAVVTGGIDVNGGRVGDPADWHETDGALQQVGGTINILLHIDAQLPEGTLARALVTCTEAKTAAIQELLAPSRYSTGLATGSGTDGTIIVTNAESPVVLTFAGKHSKLGELIGRTVLQAVKIALERQTGINAAQQFNIFSRLDRFGITREKFLIDHQSIDSEKLDALSSKSELVVMASLFVHLLDQLQWGLIIPSDAFPAADLLLKAIGFNSELPSSETDAASAVKSLVSAFYSGLSIYCSKAK